MEVKEIISILDGCVHLINCNFEVLNEPEEDEYDEDSNLDRENPGFLKGYIRYLDTFSGSLVAVDENNGNINVSLGDETDAILKTDENITKYLRVQKYKSNLIENNQSIKLFKGNL